MLTMPCVLQERDEELHKRDYINARKDKTLVALHGNAYIANQEQLKGHIFTKVRGRRSSIYDAAIGESVAK